MFGINHWEIIIILFVVVLLFGANKLPALARSVGKSVNELKRGMKDGDEAPSDAAEK